MGLYFTTTAVLVTLVATWNELPIDGILFLKDPIAKTTEMAYMKAEVDRATLESLLR